MGERAQRGYDEAEREAFRAMLLWARLMANALSVVAVGCAVAVVAMLVIGAL